MKKVAIFAISVAVVTTVYVMAGFNSVIAFTGATIWVGSMFLPQV